MKINNSSIASVFIVFVMFLPNTVYLVNQPGIPLISFRRLFIAVWVVFYLFLLIKNKSINNQIFQMPYYRGCIFLVLLLGIVTVATFTKNPLAISNYISFILETLFPVFMVWTAFKTTDDLASVIRLVIYSYTAIAVYGIITYIYGYNPMLEFLVSDDSARELLFTYDDKERGGIVGRAQSFFAHPLHFGYISSMILIFMLGVQKGLKLFTTKTLVCISIVLMVSVVLAGSRSPILLLMVAIFIYIAHSNIVNILIAVATSSIVLILVISGGVLDAAPGNYLVLFTSIFKDLATGDSGLGGSSIHMRLGQMAIATNIFLVSPVFGHGLAYIRILLDNQLAPGLLGAESFAFKLLIETGIVGMVGYIILYGSIYSSLIRYRKRGGSKRVKKMAAVGVALLGGHLSFIFATGEMGLMYIYLVLTTLILRVLWLRPCKTISYRI